MNYEKIAEEAFEEFNQLLNANWVFGYETNGVSLSRFSQGDKNWCLTVGHINTTMDDLIELTHSMDKRIHWDKSTADYQIVQNITPHIDVIYTQTKNHLAISARDFVNVRFSKKYDDDGQVYFISCSAPTTHPEKPTHDTILRGHTHVSGWKFIPSVEGTKVYYICGASLGGWIPASLVNYGIETTTFEFYSLCGELLQFNRPHFTLNETRGHSFLLVDDRNNS